jgi:predicted RNA-binding Zn-ribbon protein involved in translation (DUF1610 family)
MRRACELMDVPIDAVSYSCPTTRIHPTDLLEQSSKVLPLSKFVLFACPACPTYR